MHPVVLFTRAHANVTIMETSARTSPKRPRPWSHSQEGRCRDSHGCRFAYAGEARRGPPARRRTACGCPDARPPARRICIHEANISCLPTKAAGSGSNFVHSSSHAPMVSSLLQIFARWPPTRRRAGRAPCRQIMAPSIIHRRMPGHSSRSRSPKPLMRSSSGILTVKGIKWTRRRIAASTLLSDGRGCRRSSA